MKLTNRINKSLKNHLLNEKEEFQFTDDMFTKTTNGLIFDGFAHRSKPKNIPAKFEIPEEFEGQKIIAIGTNAFSQCYNITEVVIPKTVTEIYGDAFNMCKNLKKVEILGKLVSIGFRAFKNVIGLQSINIPNSVEYIGYEAFFNCENLTSIELPNSVKTIGTEAFAYSGLTSI